MAAAHDLRARIEVLDGIIIDSQAVPKLAGTLPDLSRVRAHYAATTRRRSPCVGAPRVAVERCRAATDGTAYVSVVGKGKKARTVRVSSATAAVLFDYRSAAPEDTYVFAGRDGSLDPSQAWRIVHDVARRAGIERSVSPHFMRHAHATRAIDRGVKITTVRDTLGHSSIAVTDRYAHVRPTESSGTSLAV